MKLYRAIDRAELNDLLRFGDYNLSPNGGGKYFAETLQAALDFQASSFGVGRDTITGMEVPVSFLENGYRFYDPKGAGWSYHFSDDVLPDLYRVMTQPEIISYPDVPQVGC